MKRKRIFSIVLVLSLILGNFLPQFNTINYAEGLEEEEITPEIALGKINAYLGTESYIYLNAPEYLQNYFEKIEGINVSDYDNLDKTSSGGKNRKAAVCYDLNNNKPIEGYDKETLVKYFNQMVATRQATEESMDKVNNATSVAGLDGISWVETLLTAFRKADYGTHSDIAVSEKVSTLEDLVNRYNGLASDENRTAVLQKMLDDRPDDGYARSQATTDALAEALTKLEGEQKTALNAVNSASDADAMKTAIETNAVVLGLDIENEQGYKKLISGRDRSVSVDLYNNRKNATDSKYTLEQLQTMFNEIVATRLVTQASMNEVNDAQKLESLKYVQILIDRFNTITKNENINNIYKQHSSHNISQRATELEGYVNKYNALEGRYATIKEENVDAQKAVRDKIIAIRNAKADQKFARSQHTIDALVTALEFVETNITKYTINFAITPEDVEGATIEVKKGEQTIEAETSGNYQLEAGTYTYTVTTTDYKTATGTFTVSEDTTILVNLEESLDISEIQPNTDVHLGVGEELEVSFKAPAGGEAYFKLRLPLVTSSIDDGIAMTEDTETSGLYKGTWTVPEGLVANGLLVDVYYTKSGNTVTGTAEGKVYIVGIETANWNATGKVGIAPDTAGDAAGNIYAEYELKDAAGNRISLATDNVEYILQKVEDKWVKLTPNTDETLWFNVEAQNGICEFKIKTTDGNIYEANLDWDKIINDATFEATGGEGPHEEKTYVEYKMLAGETPVSLAEGEVKLIAQKVEVKEDETEETKYKWVKLIPNTDGTLWFNKEKDTGKYDFFVVTKDNKMYQATLDWIKPETATWKATENVGIAPDTAGEAAGKIYAEYELLDGEERISLAEGNVEYILQKVKDKWVKLIPNTDETLYFNVEAQTGNCEFKIKTLAKEEQESKIYEAKLDWNNEINDATFEATGGEGDHEGKTYVAYKMKDKDNNDISLVEGAVKLIAQKVEGKWVKLEPNTDSTLWFNKANPTGDYEFFAVTSTGTMYKATLEWEKEENASWNPTGNVGIAPETAGDAAGNIYAEYELKDAAGERISLAADNIGETGYIKSRVKNEDGTFGEWETLTPNTDETLWFNVEAETGIREFRIKTKDNRVYTAELNWTNAIKDATFEATGKEGPHDDKTYVEYEMLAGETPVSLKADDVKLIAQKVEEKWEELEPNTDSTLWFDKTKDTGKYEFFVITKDNKMYQATLDWTKPELVEDTKITKTGTAIDGVDLVYKNGLLTISIDGSIDWAKISQNPNTGLGADADVLYVGFHVARPNDGITHVMINDGTKDQVVKLGEHAATTDTGRYYYYGVAKKVGEGESATWETITDEEAKQKTVKWYKKVEENEPTLAAIGEFSVRRVLKTNKVTFNVTPAEATVEVTKDDVVIAPEEDGTYQLPAGTYKYKVSKDGHVTKEDEFVVTNTNLTIAVDLTKELIVPELKDIKPDKDLILTAGDILEVSLTAPEKGTAYFKLRLPLGTASTDDGRIAMTEDTETPGFYKGTWTVPAGLVANDLRIDVVFEKEGYTTVTETAEGKVTVVEAINATFEATGAVGIAPESADSAAGKIYTQYILKDGEETISLAKDNVVYIKSKTADEEWKELTPDTDSSLWFNVEAETGKREYQVLTKDGKIYKAEIDWQKDTKKTVFTATGRDGIRPGTNDTYLEYEILEDGKRVSLADDNVKLIAQEVGENWVELEANTDQTLWFNINKDTGKYDFFVITNDNNMYKATLDWTKPEPVEDNNIEEPTTPVEGVDLGYKEGLLTINMTGDIDWNQVIEKYGDNLKLEGDTLYLRILIERPNEDITHVRIGEDVVELGAEGTNTTKNGVYYYLPLARKVDNNETNRLMATEEAVWETITDEQEFLKTVKWYSNATTLATVETLKVKREVITYAVNFDIKDKEDKAPIEDANIVVKRDGVEIAPVEGEYQLSNGTYTYTVSKEGYKDATGTFTVNDANVMLVVELEKTVEPTKYIVTFVTTPENAEVEVKKGEEVIEPETDGTYKLLAGSYTYTVSAEGYETATGEIGVEADRTITIELEKIIPEPEIPELTNIKPETDVELEEGEVLEVSFNAPTGGIAYFKLRLPLGTSSTNDGITMVEETSGLYKGTWTVPEGLVAENIAVDVVFTSEEAVTVRETAAGKVTIVEKTVEPTKYTITFVTTPEDAEVVVKKDNVVIEPETDGTYKLLAGAYTYTVSADGYKSATGEIGVEADRTITVVLEKIVEPTKYTITFVTTPEDAEVVVKKGGETISAKSGKTYELLAGVYEYTVSATGYEPKTNEFGVEEDREIEIVLEEIIPEPETPVLTNIEPSEDIELEEGQVLEVSFNAPTGGEAYFKLRLPLGTSSTNDGITMVEETPGFYKGTWTVPEGLVAENIAVDVVFTSAEAVTVTETAAGKVTIVEKPHTVSFNVVPADAEVVVKKGEEVIAAEEDGTYKLATGTYTYTVSAEGYIEATEEITVVEDMTIEVELEKILYTVSFDITPAEEDATVEVTKGEQVIAAEEDGTYKLEPGAYTYTVNAEGYIEATGEITVVDKDVTITIELELKEITEPMENLPTNTVIIGDEAFDIRYLNNNKDAQKKLIEWYSQGKEIYIKLGEDRIVNIRGEIVDISELPEKLTYYDANGETTIYKK